MRGFRLASALLIVTLTLVTTAAAAPEAPELAGEGDDAAAPANAAFLDTAAAGAATAASTTADGAAAAAGAVVDAARAVGSAVAWTARALADGVILLGAGLKALGLGVWSGVTVLATAFASAADAVGRALVALAHGVAGVVVTVATVVAGTTRALASGTIAAIAYAAGGLAGLLGDGAAWFGGLERREQVAVAAAGSGAAAGAGLIAWLKRAAWLGALPLYSRLAPSDMLKNGVRARIFEHIRANPGAHPSAITTALDLGWGTTVYHLTRLEDARLVRSEKQGAVKCFFLVGGDLSVTAQKQLSALRNDTARHVAEFVSANPSASQKDVGRALGMSAALVSWHVKKLSGSGVLRVERSGKSSALFVEPDVPLAEAQQSALPTPAAPALRA